MHETEKSLVISKATRKFDSLLLLYPEIYRRKFGQEMLVTFEDMYQEQLVKNERAGFLFWLLISFDIIKSSLEQHWELLKIEGVKKYMRNTLHINSYNIIGGLFLLPAFLVFSLDIISRIVQGDLVHYNRPLYAFMSHTPFYWFPVLFIWVIIFPLLAVLTNAIPLIKNAREKHGHVKSTRFLIHNLITILLLLAATFFILLVKFHDFGPCMLHGIARLGFENFTHIVAVCRNA